MSITVCHSTKAEALLQELYNKFPGDEKTEAFVDKFLQTEKCPCEILGMDDPVSVMADMMDNATEYWTFIEDCGDYFFYDISEDDLLKNMQTIATSLEEKKQ
jgi:hypothetical protein